MNSCMIFWVPIYPQSSKNFNIYRNDTTLAGEETENSLEMLFDEIDEEYISQTLGQ